MIVTNRLLVTQRNQGVVVLLTLHSVCVHAWFMAHHTLRIHVAAITVPSTLSHCCLLGMEDASVNSGVS